MEIALTNGYPLVYFQYVVTLAGILYELLNSGKEAK